MGSQQRCTRSAKKRTGSSSPSTARGVRLNRKLEYLASDYYAESPASQLVIADRKEISNITRTRNSSGPLRLTSSQE
eukprot:2292833-Pleurochrysis_carterae.AAC.1